MSGPKASAIYPRTGNGTKPKSKIYRLTSSRSLIPSLVGDGARKPPESTESFSSSLTISRSSTLPRKVYSDRRSPRRHSEERQQTAHHSPKRSPKRFLLSLDDDPHQSEMGLGLRVSSSMASSIDVEPGMSFLEFETLYTLEKRLMRSQCCSQDATPQMVTERQTGIASWFDGRRAVHTELPDPLGNQIGATASAASLQLAPTEGFSFAPGWSLNADHFYQWQHRGKTTQQVAGAPVSDEF